MLGITIVIMKYNSRMKSQLDKKGIALTIDKTQLISITSGILVYCVSLYLLPFYTGGDQVYYRRFWDALGDVEYSSLSDLLDLAFNYIGGREPLYPLFSKIASSFLEKDLFISLVNGILAYFASIYLCRINVNPGLIFITLTTNYYFLGFYLSAERLKFGILFLLISCVCNNKFVLFFRVISILGHLQIGAIYVVCLFQKWLYSMVEMIKAGKIKLFKITKNNLFLLFSASVLALAVLTVVPILLNQSSEKIGSYSKSFSISEYVRILFFYLGTVMISGQYLRFLTLFIPLFLMILVVGGDRLNFVGYLIFADTAFRVRHGLNLPSLLVTAYFSWAGFGFIQRVILHGDGWWGMVG
jgi:hypothetical protein